MKSGTIKKECPKHGLVEHTIYVYTNQKHVRCMLCEKERKKKRYSDPEKREHDKKVTKKWIEKNKKHYKRVITKNRLDKLLEETTFETTFEKYNYLKEQKEIRDENLKNGVLLCRKCHRKVHGMKWGSHNI